MKTTKLRSLNMHHKENIVKCIKKNMKTNFSTVHSIDEYRTILDRPDGWDRY